MKKLGFLNLPIWQDKLQELLKKYGQELLTEFPVLGSEGLEKPWFALEKDDFFASVDTGIIFSDRYEYNMWPEQVITCDTSIALKRIRDGFYNQTFFRAATGASFSLFGIINSSLVFDKPQKFIVQNDSVTGFVLSKMEREGKSIEEAIRDAQWKGIVLDNPNTHLHGVITRDRFSLQLTEVFGEFVDPENIETLGINTLELQDVFIASRMNRSIRLLGIAEKINGNLSVCVEPCIIPEKYFLAQAKGGSEIAYIQDETGKSHVYACPGFSEESSVMGILADLNDPVKKHKKIKILNNIVSYPGKFYLRIYMDTLICSISSLAKIFADNDVTVSSLRYENLENNDSVKQIIVITEVAEREKISRLSYHIDKKIKNASVKSVFRFIE